VVSRAARFESYNNAVLVMNVILTFWCAEDLAQKQAQCSSQCRASI
jgi:hypothetical protein